MSQPVAPELAAGTDATVQVKVRCASGCDLRGAAVRVIGPGGVVVTTSDLVEHQEKVNETAAFTVQAPADVGEHAWTVVFPRHENKRVVHEESALPISFRTEPHRTSLAVWDIPSPVVKGQRFTTKIGAKCLAGCELTGRDFEVCDESGKKVATGSLGKTPWPGTTALYWAEVDLVAPSQEGVSSWSASLAADGHGLAHGGASSKISFATVKPPEHTLRVKVVQQGTAVPIGNAQVRLGAFGASTDESGLAIVETPKGVYDLVVWKAGYEAPTRSLEVTEDVTVQVEALKLPDRSNWEDD